MEALQQGEVRIPLGGDKVYKDQCVYSFDTPVSSLSMCDYSLDHVQRYRNQLMVCTCVCIHFLALERTTCYHTVRRRAEDCFYILRK